MNGTIAYQCDICGHYQRHNHPERLDLKCPACDTLVCTVPENWLLEYGCPVCKCRHLYRRKNFNQVVGLVIILVGAFLAVVISYWILAAVTLMDILLYRFVPEVAVCYRCGAEANGIIGTGELSMFDHHTAEMYES